jgi:hypothetical protein
LISRFFRESFCLTFPDQFWLAGHFVQNIDSFGESSFEAGPLRLAE